jgi:hypothetical protein
MVPELNSRVFRDHLFYSINGRDRQVMSAEAEISSDSDLVTIYRRTSSKFVEVTPIYTIFSESNPTIDLFVESGIPGVYRSDFLKFLEIMVNSDQIFSPGNSLHNCLRQEDLDRWRTVLKRVPPLDEPKMTCSVHREVKSKADLDAVLNAFYNYMGMPVLFYLNRMGEFFKQ